MAPSSSWVDGHQRQQKDHQHQGQNGKQRAHRLAAGSGIGPKTTTPLRHRWRRAQRPARPGLTQPWRPNAATSPVMACRDATRRDPGERDTAIERPSKPTLRQRASPEWITFKNQRHGSTLQLRTRQGDANRRHTASVERSQGFMVQHKTVSILAQYVIENNDSSYGQETTTSRRPWASGRRTPSSTPWV